MKEFLKNYYSADCVSILWMYKYDCRAFPYPINIHFLFIFKVELESNLMIIEAPVADELVGRSIYRDRINRLRADRSLRNGSNCYGTLLFIYDYLMITDIDCSSFPDRSLWVSSGDMKKFINTYCEETEKTVDGLACFTGFSECFLGEQIENHEYDIQHCALYLGMIGNENAIFHQRSSAGIFEVETVENCLEFINRINANIYRVDHNRLLMEDGRPVVEVIYYKLK